MNVFNEKTVAALTLYGFDETSNFVRLVCKLWNCLNTKSPDAARNLNDPIRESFKSTSDERFIFLSEMSTFFEEMDTSKSKHSKRVMCLTTDTSNALKITFSGLIVMIKKLLGKGFHYVLPGSFQSDHLEGEFGLVL